MSLFDRTETGTEGASNWWNYAHPEKEGYSLRITGDVVEMKEKQRYKFGTKEPDVWPDGNPKLDIQIVLVTKDGDEVNFAFSPGGRGDKASAFVKALWRALADYGITDPRIGDMAGKNVTIQTKSEWAGNARPWGMRINGDASNPFRGFTEFKPGTEGDAKGDVLDAPKQAAVSHDPEDDLFSGGGTNYYDDEIPFS